MVRVSKAWLLKYVKSVGTENIFFGDSNTDATLEGFRECIAKVKPPFFIKMPYNWSSNQKSHFEWGCKAQMRVYIFKKIEGEEPRFIRSFDVRNY